MNKSFLSDLDSAQFTQLLSGFMKDSTAYILRRQSSAFQTGLFTFRYSMKDEVTGVHELSIMEGVLNMVRESAQQNNINRVNKINLVIGKLSMVLPDSLSFCFQALSIHEELFKDAILEIEGKDTMIQCDVCKQQFIPEDDWCLVCPGCGGSNVSIISGREMYLDYYEGDDN